MKYRGLKKYSYKEACDQIENTMQMRSVYIECIFTWKTKQRDTLIEALCNQTTEEMIKETEKKLEYVDSKMEYLYQFCEGYVPKGSFAFFSVCNKKLK